MFAWKPEAQAKGIRLGVIIMPPRLLIRTAPLALAVILAGMAVEARAQNGSMPFSNTNT